MTTNAVVWGEYVVLKDGTPIPTDQPNVKYVHESYAREYIAGQDGYGPWGPSRYLLSVQPPPAVLSPILYDEIVVQVTGDKATVYSKRHPLGRPSPFPASAFLDLLKAGTYVEIDDAKASDVARAWGAAEGVKRA